MKSPITTIALWWRKCSTKPNKATTRIPGYPDHPDGGHKIYKNISVFVALPLIIVLSVYILGTRAEEPRVPFIPYEYLRRRTRRYPWGDGNKTFFHNPDRNALPEGYEDGNNCVPIECQERLERIRAGEDPDTMPEVNEN